MQQGKLKLVREELYALRREVHSAATGSDAKIQSLLRRVMELEKRIGIFRNGKYLRRERIQIGLDIAVADNRGLRACGLPFLIVIFAILTTVVPTAYKYVFST